MRLQHAQAQDRNTDPSVLDDLAGSDDPGERLLVALNPSTPDETLDRLAGDEHPQVAEAASSRLLQRTLFAAQDPSTPPETLGLMAGSSNAEVRWAVACNPSAPTRVIEALVTDADPEVRAAAVEHPNAPSWAAAAGGLVAD